ncbi:MAG: hypothetical protein ACRDQA_08550 [Nocardioidaceae bacterium]
MSDPIPRLADLLSASPDPRAPVEIVASVQTVREDGTVNLKVLGSVILGIACDASYTPRKAGDTVVVSVRGRQWRVAGRTGPEARPSLSLPKTTKVGWGGNAPAGAGWHTGEKTWVRETGGAYEVYVQNTSDPSPPEGGGSDPNPDPQTVHVSHGSTYVHNRDDSYHQTPTQGDWAGSGDRTGCWFYGNDLHQAVNAHPVDHAVVHLSRVSKPHGEYSPVRMTLHLHDETSATRGTPTLHNAVGGPNLDIGEGAHWELPGPWVASLQGSARGIAITGHGRSEYLIASDSATVTVYYSGA